MRVIDSSALVKYFSREEGWERVRELLLGGVATLDLAFKEVANALLKKVFREEVSYETALTIVRELAEERPFPLKEQGRYMTKAFDIALKHGTTIYDALFIALAIESKSELITSDRKQADTASINGVKVILID